MGQILVRNLDEAVIEKLKAKAKAQGKSTEQFLRDLLSAEAGPDLEEVLVSLDAIRTSTRGKPVVDPVEAIREDRDTDHGRF